MGQLVADQRGELLGARLAAQVLLEAGEVVERVEFEQGGQRGVRTRGVALQPLGASAELQGVEIAGIAEEAFLGAGNGAVIELLAEILLGQLRVSGAAPARREGGDAEGVLGIGVVTQGGAGEAELVIGAGVIGVDAQRVAGEAERGMRDRRGGWRARPARPGPGGSWRPASGTTGIASAAFT